MTAAHQENGDAEGVPGRSVSEVNAFARITSIEAYDPDGDDGEENDDEAVLALADGDLLHLLADFLL